MGLIGRNGRNALAPKVSERHRNLSDSPGHRQGQSRQPRGLRFDLGRRVELLDGQYGCADGLDANAFELWRTGIESNDVARSNRRGHLR
jgi:hypothetical protein